MFCERRPSVVTPLPRGEETVDKVNFDKLHFIYWEAAPEFLRQLFRQLWENLTKSPWVDGRESGKKLLETCSAVLGKKCRKENVESGNIALWDLPLLLDFIECLRPQVTPADLLELLPSTRIVGVTPNNFAFLKATRKELATAAQMSVDDVTFKSLWANTSTVLTSMGMAAGLLVDNSEKTETKATDEVVPTESSRKAEEFRSAGNELFTKKRFPEAAAEFSAGILLEDVPPESLGLLFSNRAAAKLELKMWKAARDDAKSCVTLQPKWFRGYARLGKAYGKLKNFDKAALNLKIAIHLGDSSVSTFEALQSLKLGTAKYPRPVELKGDTPQVIIDLFQSWPGIQLCVVGLRYRIGGDGFPVDYNKAAAFFSKAAEMGEASGLYNLGTMYSSPLVGFPTDNAKGFEFLLRAAAQDPLKETVEGSGQFTMNPGVAESCHWVGFVYNVGGFAGVAVDLKKALEYYGKALEFGHFSSACSIANLYLREDPPEDEAEFLESRTIVADYWRIGALLKEVKAAEFIAETSLTLQNFSVAQEYFHFAILNGSVELQGRRAEFVRDAYLERNFDEHVFTRELEKSVRRSAVVGPVLKKIIEFRKKLKLGG